jgi:argonaute-like protein implicated in RNA metabolism and viral defense
MGTAVRLGNKEVVVLTTGEPMLRRGTAHPLLAELISGELDIMDIAHDIYALSHLTFTAPGSCLRLPFTIALADHILRESTPGREDELWDDERKEAEASMYL